MTKSGKQSGSCGTSYFYDTFEKEKKRSCRLGGYIKTNSSVYAFTKTD